MTLKINKSLPTDIPEMRNLTIKRSNKRKLKPNYDLQDMNNDQPDINPLTISDPPDNEIQIQTQFNTQDDESLPPDPVTLAQYLFIYWQQGLHFHEHIEQNLILSPKRQLMNCQFWSLNIHLILNWRRLQKNKCNCTKEHS